MFNEHHTLRSDRLSGGSCSIMPMRRDALRRGGQAFAFDFGATVRARLPRRRWIAKGGGWAPPGVPGPRSRCRRSPLAAWQPALDPRHLLPHSVRPLSEGARAARGSKAQVPSPSCARCRRQKHEAQPAQTAHLVRAHGWTAQGRDECHRAAICPARAGSAKVDPEGPRRARTATAPDGAVNPGHDGPFGAKAAISAIRRDA